MLKVQPTTVVSTKKILVTPLHTSDVNLGLQEFGMIVTDPQSVLQVLRLIREYFKTRAKGTPIQISEQKIPVYDARFQSNNSGQLELVVDTQTYPYAFGNAHNGVTVENGLLIFQLGQLINPLVSITKDTWHQGLPSSKGSGTYHVYRGVKEFGGLVEQELRNGLDIKIVPNIDLGNGDKFMFRIGRPTQNIDTSVRDAMITLLAGEQPSTDIFISGNEATDGGIKKIIAAAGANAVAILATPTKKLLCDKETMEQLSSQASYVSMNHEELFDYYNLTNPQEQKELLTLYESYSKLDEKSSINHKLNLIVETYCKSFPERKGNTIITMEGLGACCLGYDEGGQIVAVHTNTTDSHQPLLDDIQNICNKYGKDIIKHLNPSIQNPIGCGDSVMMGIAQKRQSQEVYDIIQQYNTVDDKIKELLVDGITAQLFGYLTYHCTYTNIFQLKDEDKLGVDCFEEFIEVIKSYYHKSIDQILSDYSKYHS